MEMSGTNPSTEKSLPRSNSDPCGKEPNNLHAKLSVSLRMQGNMQCAKCSRSLKVEIVRSEHHARTRRVVRRCLTRIHHYRNFFYDLNTQALSQHFILFHQRHRGRERGNAGEFIGQKPKVAAVEKRPLQDLRRPIDGSEFSCSCLKARCAGTFCKYHCIHRYHIIQVYHTKSMCTCSKALYLG